MKDDDECVFMVRGEDDLGDQHIFVTTDRDRAFNSYADFLNGIDRSRLMMRFCSASS